MGRRGDKLGEEEDDDGGGGRDEDESEGRVIGKGSRRWNGRKR